MTHVNMQEAKAQLSRLVERAAGGEEIVIAQGGRPVARLVAYRETTGKRVPGRWRGRILIHEDFDDPLPEEITARFGDDGAA